VVNRDNISGASTLDERLKEIRKEYSRAVLDEDSCGTEPLSFLERWLKEALEGGLAEPNAMVVSTVDRSGSPSARAVLLKQLTPEGLVFYTNYGSRKAREIEGNSAVAATFVWPELERQVRVQGRVRKIERSQTESYFRSRPRGSQLAALVSHQSERLSSRKELEERYAMLEKQYQNSEVPCPENWGGFLIMPTLVEFWQGRESRLHDRIVFELSGGNIWERRRLWP
jgi:pyridoxamine 5'-phosphate oxidase